jgi:predicted small metal-binding protein
VSEPYSEAYSKINLMLSLGCRDTGAGVLGCDYVAKGETEEELWRDGTEHLIKAHGVKAEDITPQFKYYYRQYIKHR